MSRAERPGAHRRRFAAIGGYLLAASVLVLAALASQRYFWQLDLTAGGRNSLSEASRALLPALPEPVELTAYLGRDNRGREVLRQLIERYQRHKPDISLRFVDPADVPDTARELDIRTGGELFVRYGEAETRLGTVSEQTLSGALQQLARGARRWLVFLSGHGERDPLDASNHGLGRFGQYLQRAGYRLFRQSLALAAVVPDNTRVLTIASARSAYLPGEVALVMDYLDRGGNLLWLVEPNQLGGLRTLADALGLELVPGVVADPNAQRLSAGKLDFTLAADFAANHPVTAGFANMCLLPRSAGLRASTDSWQVSSLLRSNPRSWAEIDDLEGAVLQPERGDSAGPLDLALAFVRARAGGDEQRVVVVGDGDFLSNTYLDNGGNLELGLKLFNWLSGDDAFIGAQRQPAADVSLALSTPLLVGYAVAFLLAAPLALLGTGLAIRWRRRRH